jgi:hypothetical protein
MRYLSPACAGCRVGAAKVRRLCSDSWPLVGSHFAGGTDITLVSHEKSPSNSWLTDFE